MGDARTASAPASGEVGSARPKLLVLDNCYSLRLIEERHLQNSVTGRDLDGYFQHVWSVHPLVGASPEHGAQTRVGPPTWHPLAPAHTVIEGSIARYRFLRRVPMANFLAAQCGLFRQMHALMRREGVALVLANDPLYLGLMGLGLARLNGARFAICLIANYEECYTLRGALAYPKLLPSYRLQRALQRFVLVRAELVTAGNRNNADYALRNGLAEDRLAFFNLGDMIEPIHFSEPKADPAIRDELNLGDRPFCLTVSRLAEEKHPEDVVHALTAAKAYQSGLAAVLVGDGPMRANLDAIIRQHGLEKDVVFAGYRDQAWIARAVRTANVVVSPLSGRALVEAALGGRPIVAYDADWQAEFVDHEETGIIVPYRDVEAMGGAIARLIAEPALADALGAAGRAKALATIDPVSSMEQKRRSYGTLLENGRAAAELREG